MSRRDLQQKGHAPGRRETSSKYRNMKRVPKGENFVLLTLSLWESEALDGLSLTGWRILRRLIIEHLRHAGRENGRLEVSYDQFEQAGCTRRSITSTLRELQKRGLLKVTEVGEWRGKASRYELTFLNTAWRPSNEWKRFKGGMDAQGHLRHRSRASETPVPPSPRASETPVPRASETPSSRISGRAVGGGARSVRTQSLAEQAEPSPLPSDHDILRRDGTPEPATPAHDRRMQAIMGQVGGLRRGGDG
jgi:hypothetical protein